MDQDAPAKPREQKVSNQRTRWKILLLILCLLHGSSMSAPHRRPHSRGLQVDSPTSRTHLCTMEAHTASTPPCCWKNSLTGANALRGPRLVSGEPGGAVTIHCHYAPSSVNRHQRKYWCRLGPPLWICYTIVSTNHYTHHDYRGRVALTDLPQSSLFTVKLSRLSLNDTGLYRCGIGDRNDMLFFRMNLIVSAGPSNTTYAAAPASGELITASPGIASTAANRWMLEATPIPEGQGWTPEVTPILEAQGSQWDRTALTTRISKTTASPNGRQTPRTARMMLPRTSSREEGSIRTTVPTLESPASKSRSMLSTTPGVRIWGTRNSVTTSASTSEGGGKGATSEADGPREETEVSASPEAPRKTTGTTGPSVLISEHVTWETLQQATEDSKQQTRYSVEESSPVPSAWTLNTTHMPVPSGSIYGSLENIDGESSPPTPSQLSSGSPRWAPGQGSSMKSAFTGGESNSWILTPVSSVLALVLLVALVLLKRRLRRERTSQEAERPPRITLIQMTHFLPDKLPAVLVKDLQQGDLPSAQASLTVLEKDPGP
ncbi:high affinity immunoglobulin alpha and immunoglobulin mu Fc receptor [Onychomys torridus]|uniref:high affinity immunoglobulin alpha and immunoglobulin mu Fc receptor n=1 Tax=Onychomys torridus TaxID=38674 RepID=UPI00167F5D95|nr:high affinity immunoglobulin alpha and immunoglobulin mu Fc receptor [Onychomys torridus]